MIDFFFWNRGAAGVWWNHLRNDMSVSFMHAGAP